jgi:hypothetical protein
MSSFPFSGLVDFGMCKFVDFGRAVDVSRILELNFREGSVAWNVMIVTRHLERAGDLCGSEWRRAG